MSLAALAKKHSEQASGSTKSLSSLIKSKTTSGVSLKNLSAKPSSNTKSLFGLKSKLDAKTSLEKIRSLYNEPDAVRKKLENLSVSEEFSRSKSESPFNENKLSAGKTGSCGRITKRKAQNSSNILCALEFRSQAKIFTDKENSARVPAKSAALDFHSQFSRFDREDLLRWNLHALLEYPRTNSLFDFKTLSPDGTVLEAQKKAFTRS